MSKKFVPFERLQCLSVRQPFATAIVSGAKLIENRKWQTKKRGTIAIHASGSLATWWRDYWPASTKLMTNESVTALPKMAIIGIVDIVDCVESHKSAWFTGPYGFVLSNPIMFA